MSTTTPTLATTCDGSRAYQHSSARDGSSTVSSAVAITTSSPDATVCVSFWSLCLASTDSETLCSLSLRHAGPPRSNLSHGRTGRREGEILVTYQAAAAGVFEFCGKVADDLDEPGLSGFGGHAEPNGARRSCLPNGSPMIPGLSRSAARLPGSWRIHAELCTAIACRSRHVASETDGETPRPTAPSPWRSGGPPERAGQGVPNGEL